MAAIVQVEPNTPANMPAKKPTIQAPVSTPVLNDAALNLAKIELLHQHFPQVLEVDDKGNYVVNATKLQLALDLAGVKVEEDGYELRWAGKREAYHTAFTPVQKVLTPLPSESKDWDTTNNVLMRGDNLDALRLLRHSYFGKIKLIYIDPPYNTQSDAFIYRDDFSASQSQLLEQLGYDKDNIEYIKNIYGAKTHSGWLSFMYPRLLLAKDLLRDDGVIFISIDDNEQAQLKLLCDEVFGEQNFVATFIWEHRKSSQNDVDVSLSHNYKLVYAKNRELFRLNALGIDVDKFTNPDSDPRGPWVADPLDAPNIRENLTYPITNPDTGITYLPPKGRHWRFSPEKFAEVTADNRIVFGKNGTSKPQFKRFQADAELKGVNPFTIWTGCGTATEATKELMALFSGQKIFETPKPVRLLNEIIQLATSNNDLILDFFAGSGTTGEAVMRLNAEDGGTRQFILVQIPQPIDAKKQKEAHQFVTQTLGKPATIFEITAERLRRAGAAVQAKHPADKPPVDTGFRIFDIVPDLDALILQKPLSAATQDDLSFFTDGSPIAPNEAASTLHDKTQQVLHNLLLSEGLPLITRLKEIMPSAVYLASDVALIIAPVELDALSDALTALRDAGTPAQHLTVYAPWVRSDNFMQGIKTLAQSLGYSADKLRLRG